jgi:ceramide glucosyltransferase
MGLQNIEHLFAWGFAAVAVAGIAHLAVGTVAAWRFSRRRSIGGKTDVPVTILKPLYGDEKLLYEALGSFCRQDYPTYQIVFGVRDPNDAALKVVRRLQAELPHVDIEVVIDAMLHGQNRKISNLINMVARAKYDLYVISDSDMHVTPDYLGKVVAEFARPNVGVVTSLYTAKAVGTGFVSDLAVSNINHLFFPSALVGMWLGRADCFGATMAFTRQTLTEIGGWDALANQLADDYVLGHKAKAMGYDVALAPVLPATTIAENDFHSLFVHELRWLRTIRAMVPVGFVAGLIQYPVAFALLACVAGGWTGNETMLLVATAVTRIAAAGIVDRILKLAPVPFWLTPLRDVIAFVIVLASFCGRQVQWRGQSLLVEADGSIGFEDIVQGESLS